MSILNLPHAFDLVVGDTFEMFYRGILKCVNPSVYDLEFTWQSGAQSGASYRRKFVFTPTEEDVGTRALLVTLRDNMLPTQSLPVNTRSTKTETVNTNALHPTEEGYFQIADAFYRRMVSHLQGEE